MKKSWHPQRSGNIAATNKAEAEAIAERKKLQQRLQEIEEERRKEEIQKTLEATGGKPRLQRVEWMYSGPNDGAGDAAENEAYLLGKRRIDKLLQDNEVKKLQKQPSQDAVAAVPTPLTNTRDMATKIREDPLLAIKRQEQQAYEAMMNDPIKRRQLLASMGIDDAQDADKTKRREERRHKHRHSQHRSHRHRDDDRDSKRHSHRRRSGSRDRSRSPRGYGPQDEHDRRRRRRDSRDRRRDRSGSADSRGRGDRRDGRDRQDARDRGGDIRTSRHRDGPSNAESRTPSPAPRRREYSPDRDGRRRSPVGDGRRRRNPSANRDGPPRRNTGDTNGYRNGSYRDDGTSRPQNRSAPRQPDGRPSNPPDAGGETAEQERARKLAAMQEAATDLDKDRERRLAMIAERDRAAQEADDRVRQRNKKFGGDVGFMNQLHSRAAELKVADRAGAR